MKRKELMAAVALAAGMTAGVAATTNTFAAPKHGVEQAHPGHTIGKGMDRARLKQDVPGRG